MMIKLGENVHVAADEIKSLSMSYYKDRVLVKLKDGSTHEVLPEYGQGAHAAYDNLLNHIQSALEKCKCANTKVY